MCKKKPSSLNQLRIPLPEDQRLEPGDEPLDSRDADGELLRLGEAVVVLLVLLQLVELVRRRDVLDERLEEVLGEELRVAPQDELACIIFIFR